MQLFLCAFLSVVAHIPSTEAFSSSSIISSRTAHQRYSIQNRRGSVNRNEQYASRDDDVWDDFGPGYDDPPKEYLATCIPGLAPYLEDELLACGAASTDVLSNAAVSFTTAPTASDNNDGTTTSIDTVPLKALIWVRTAHRILEKIDTFYDIGSRDDVYDAIQHSRIPVKDLLGDGQGGLLSLSVKVIVNGGRLPKDISHSHYTALTIKNALVDQVRDLREDGERPDVDLDDPDVPLVAILHSNGPAAEMTLYRSLAPPGSLHRRGYRAGGAIHKAAMKESMAAGLLLAAGWKDACDNLRASTTDDEDDNSDGLTLVDPMCGSGSLLLEAAMMAVDFSPGLMRIMNGVQGHQIPPVLRWKDNKDTLTPIWKDMLLDSSQRVKSGLSWMRDNEGKLEIIGNDIHGGALDLVESSLANARGLDRIVDLYQNDCSEWNIVQKEERKNQKIWVMTNPPWGVRLSDNDHESWESLRVFLRENCPAGRTQAWVLSGNKSATKHLGLRRSQSVPLKTGQQDLRWIQYIMLERQRAASPVQDSKDETPEQRGARPTSTSPALKRDTQKRSNAEDTEQRDAQPTSPTLQHDDQPHDQQRPTRSRSQGSNTEGSEQRNTQQLSPTLQRDDQQRLIRTRSTRSNTEDSEQRNTQQLSPTLQRDDQQRLIRTRSTRSPGTIQGGPREARQPRRVPAGASTSKDDDTWS